MPNKDRLLSAINKAESSSYGADNNGELSSIRARSIEDYLGEPYGDEVEGQSQVVSRDVFDTIETIKPSLARIFTGGDRVCKFDPVGPEDEQQAEQETDYINYVIQDKNDWFRIFYDWMSDGLMTKNAYAMAYFDKSVDVETEKYNGLLMEELAMLLQDPEVEITAHSPSEDGMLHDVEIKRTKHKGQVKICVLPPERCKVDEDTPSFSVKGANYFEYWDYKTLSEIREMGLELDEEELKQGAQETGRDTPEDAARDGLGEERGDNSPDSSMVKHKIRMIWLRHDYNEDGIAELLFVIRVANEVPFIEECNNIPVASIVPTPLPHRHMGLSIRDMVTDLQRIKTELWRQTLNNMYLANNGRYGVSNKVNLDDMLVSRAGGIVRVDGLPGQEIMPFNHPFVAQHSLGLMEAIDAVRENRTGTNRYFTGSDSNSLNKTASGIAQLSSAASQRVEMIARVIAEGVKELFQIVHELTIKHADASRQDKVRLKGQWVPIDPSTWKKRSDLKIAVGLGTGNKEVMGVNLANILMMQEKAMMIGATEPSKVYNALAEVTKNYGFPNPDAFFTQPKPGPMQPPPDPKMVKVQQDAQANQQKMQMDAQQSQQQMQMDAQQAQQKQMMEHQSKAQEMQVEAQFEAMKAQFEERLEMARMQREAQFEQWKAELDAKTKVVIAEINAGAAVEAAKHKKPEAKA